MTAAQLRTRILASARIAYQGYAESNIDLNLPRLPDLGNVVGLLDGSTDQYAWYRSPGLWRSDVLTSAGEEDTYQTSQGTFIWSYSSNLLTEVIGAQPVRLPRAADLLPPALALRLLGFAGPADRVSRLPTQRVAGIDAAGLRLVPASAASTIGSVDIWADPVTGLPVQVEVFGKGTGPPVLTTRFLDLSLARPPLSTVTPNPAPEVGYSTTALPNVAGVLNGFGPPLPASWPASAGSPIRAGWRTSPPTGLGSPGSPCCRCRSGSGRRRSPRQVRPARRFGFPAAPQYLSAPRCSPCSWCSSHPERSTC